MSATILPLSEQEVHLNMCGDEPDIWYAFTDYPKWQRHLEQIGATLVRVCSDGIGREYKLRADQVFIRTGKKRFSDAEKAQRGARLRAYRQNATVSTTE